MTDACAPFRELLSAQLDGDLSGAEEQQLLDHLASCSVCQLYRRRLKKTVAAIRGAEVSLVNVPDSVYEGLPDRLEPDRLEIDEACVLPRELISAQIDGELSDAEGEVLLAHLEACAACQLHRKRLGGFVGRIRGAGVLLVEAPDDVYAQLDARLNASGAETIPLEAAVTELTLAPASDSLESVDEPLPAALWRPISSRADAPRGRVIPWPQVARWAAAAAVIAVAAALAYDRVPVIQSAMQRFLPTDTKTEVNPNVPIAKDPTPPTPPVVPEGPIEIVKKPPSNEDLLPPDPVDEPRPPTPDEPEPRDPIVDQPPADGGTELPPTQERKPVVVEIQVAALRDLLRRIQSKGLSAEERAELVASLGEARFDHPDAYAFLAQVLRGRLDGFDEPSTLRSAAFGALGDLGTVEAVAVLVEAPLRRAHLDRDSADLVGALALLEDGVAVRALASVFERRKKPDPERALLFVEALDGLRRPECVAGLLALYQDRGEPAPLRREAALALGRAGDDRAFGPIRDGLGDRKPRVRSGSALALGSLATALPDDAPACVAALASALDDRNTLVALAAVEGLGLSRRREAIQPLIACLDGKTRKAVVSSALKTLRRLAGPKQAKRTRGLRSADQWRKFWGQGEPVVDAVIAPVPTEDLDLKAFRQVAADSRGVVFVIDTSGSMEPKWDAVCYELKKALELCGPETHFQVLFFSDAPRALWTNPPLRPATAEAKARALEAARGQSVVSSGQTAIGMALTRALDYSQAETVYLISDGLESRVTFSGLQRAVRRQNVRRARPAKIHTVHVRFGGSSVDLAPFDPQAGEPEDVTFMRKLAWENGGVYAHN